MEQQHKEEVQIQVLRLGPVVTNCYLVRSASGSGFIVDPAADSGRISREAAAMGLKPEAVLLTHGHYDHIGACAEIARMYHIPVYAGEKETELLSNAEWNLSGDWWGTPVYLKADRTVKDGDLLTVGDIAVRVLETPGHTGGSVSWYLPDSHILFSGDTLFAQSYGRTDLPTGSESDMIRSIRRLLAELPGDTKVYPGHGEATDILTEKEYNPLTEQP